MASRCGRWVWSLGGTLNDDQWSCVFKTFLPCFHSFFSYITINHQPLIAFVLLFFFFFQKSFCLFYVDLDCVVGSKAKMLVGNKQERRLRVATWNFQGCVLIINKRKLENC